MKKTMLAFLLIASIVMLSALESDPSDVVGFVKYEMVEGNNFIAVPMDAGYLMSGELADEITDANQIGMWDAASQGWDLSAKHPFTGAWVNPFGIDPGMALMVRVTSVSDFYIAGAMFVPEPNYGILVGNNAIMVPLSRNDLSTSALLGDDMVNVNQLGTWDAASQGWDLSAKHPFTGAWVNPFATSIAMPVMVRATAEFTWPAPPVMGSSPSITNQNNYRK